MNIAHQIRIYPTAEQEIAFRKACGVARFAYNWALDQWQRRYHEAKALGEKPGLSEGALRRKLNAIKHEEFPWMAETPKGVPQAAIIQLGIAFDRFFKKKAKYPKRKKKNGKRDSFRADNAAPHLVMVSGRYVKLPVFGTIRMAEKLRFAGKLSSVTIRRYADRWFIAFSMVDAVSTDERRKEKITRASENQAGVVGVDVGLKRMAVWNDGTTTKRREAAKPLRKALRRLAKAQRVMCRRQKGSGRRARAKMRVARVHYRVRCQRQDVSHKLTTELARTFNVVAIEDLNVKGMMRNRKLARAISDVGFGEVRRQLKYKCPMYGSALVLVDRWFPSSKLCSGCGEIHEGLTLSDREWTCQHCGTCHDRDENAAQNIRWYAMYQLATGSSPGRNARGGYDLYLPETGKQVDPMKRECSVATDASAFGS